MSYRHDGPLNIDKPSDEQLLTQASKARAVFAKAAEAGEWLSVKQIMGEGVSHRFSACVALIRRGDRVENGDGGHPMAIDKKRQPDGKWLYRWREYEAGEPMPPPPNQKERRIAELEARVAELEAQLAKPKPVIYTTQLELLR